MISSEILESLKIVLKQNKRIGLHEPVFRGNELKYLKDCINTTFVSTVGKYTDQFEKNIAKFVGSKRAIAVVNGTVALQMKVNNEMYSVSRALSVLMMSEIKCQS